MDDAPTAIAKPALDRLRDAAIVARWTTGLAGVAILTSACINAVLLSGYRDRYVLADGSGMPFALLYSSAMVSAEFGTWLIGIAGRWRDHAGAATLSALTVVAGYSAWRHATGDRWSMLIWLLWPTVAGLGWLFVKERRRALPGDAAEPLQAVAMLGLSLAYLIVGNWIWSADDWTAQLRTSAAVAICAILAVVCVRVPPALPEPPPSRRWPWMAVAALPLFWWLEGLLVVWVYTPAGWEYIGQWYDYRMRGLTNAERWLALACLAPVFEELLFRQMLFPWLAKVVGLGRAAFLQAAAFALVHVNPTFIPFVFVIGLGLAWLRWRAGLLACIAAHAIWNGLCAWRLAP